MNNDKFCSIAELAFTGISIQQIASAIELKGFYTWDRFNRYRLILPNEDNDELIKIRATILNELARTYDPDMIDTDLEEYFYGELQDEYSFLGNSGWLESDLPDFKKIQTDWNQKYAGKDEVPEPKEPANQSKVWELLHALLVEKIGEDDFNEICEKQTTKTQVVCGRIEKDFGITITPTTLKKYLKSG